MKVDDPGHKFRLEELDGYTDYNGQLLTFVKREGEGYPGNVGHHPGTTIQEVMRAVVNRLTYVNNQRRAVETELACDLAKQIIILLESRAARCHGMQLPQLTVEQLLTIDPCHKCGHLVCPHRGTIKYSEVKS